MFKSQHGQGEEANQADSLETIFSTTLKAGKLQLAGCMWPARAFCPAHRAVTRT